MYIIYMFDHMGGNPFFVPDLPSPHVVTYLCRSQELRSSYRKSHWASQQPSRGPSSTSRFAPGTNFVGNADEKSKFPPYCHTTTCDM